jgi:hypothetical protein
MWISTTTGRAPADATRLTALLDGKRKKRG